MILLHKEEEQPNTVEDDRKDKAQREHICRNPKRSKPQKVNPTNKFILVSLKFNIQLTESVFLF